MDEFDFASSQSTLDPASSGPRRFSTGRSYGQERESGLPPSYDTVSFCNSNNTSSLSFLNQSIRGDNCVSSSGFETLHSGWDDLPSSIASNNSSVFCDRLEGRKAKQMEQRSTIITEMIQSERDYCRDLRVCANTFIFDDRVKGQMEEKGISMSSIFRNLKDIITVSEKLTTLLEEKNLCKKPENQLVGSCFLEVIEELRSSYLVYCRDHEEVPKVWRTAAENPQLQRLLQSCLEKIKAETNCFDVPSLLIKPIQRILKYPLLLGELVKYTEESHQDYQPAIKAANMMTELAHEINEKKRQKDLVFRYKKDGHESLTSKISKINFRSMRKKGSRFQVRLTSGLGLATLAKDPKFDEELDKFKSLKKTIETFLKDLNTYALIFQDLSDACFQLSEDIGAYYADKCRLQEVEEFRTSQRLLKTEYFEEFKKNLHNKIYNVLQQLLNKFQNPFKLVDKRYDKLLDLEAAANRCESNKDQSRFRTLKEEESLAKHNYEALNAQLIADLPVFISSSMQVLENCIGAFMRIKRMFLGKITNQMMQLLDLPTFLGSAAINSNEEIMETFDIKFKMIIDQMRKDFTIMGNHLEDSSSARNLIGTLDRRKEKSKHRLSIGYISGATLIKKETKYQDDFSRATIKQSYRGNIYRVTRDYESPELAPIAIRRGDIVGVVKYKDPSGNPHLWFVDNGIDQGLVPETILTPEEGTVGPPPILSQQTPQTFPEHANQPITQQALYPNLNPQKEDTSHAYDLPPESQETSNTQSAINHYTNLAAINEHTDAYYPPTYDEVTEKQSEIAQHLENNLSIIDDTTPLSANSSYQTANSFDSSRYANIEEFDPLATSSPLNTTTESSGNLSTHSLSTSKDSSREIDDSDNRVLVLRNYRAAYPFAPQGPHQLALFEGEIVLVKYGSDKEGNTEWFYVRNREFKEGYVPANYLVKLD